MKIFSATQVRQWDAYTIANEPISSVDLMERAATQCFSWLINKFGDKSTYIAFCGTGNNGGDGLAIARMLLRAGHTVSVYVLEGQKRSLEFSANLDRIKPLTDNLQFISENNFHAIPAGRIAIDALFGSGLSRPLRGLPADLINHINLACQTIISIDVPSGLFTDTSSKENVVIRANHTLSFQVPKLAFFMEANNVYTGEMHLLDIGLHANFYRDEPCIFNTIDMQSIGSIYKPRNQFSHKYNFGHALLYAGSKDMMGAAILCAKACLRSGAGLVTVFTEDQTQPVIQAAFPEAITTTNTDVDALWQKKRAAGIGPGLKVSASKKELLIDLILRYEGAIVIDATALQMLAEDTAIIHQRSANPVILTPHTGEFEKLFGKTGNDFERIELALERSSSLQCYIILKGHHTLIACPDGSAYFNTTGNAGMATAGSGDVLTGMLTGLLAQGYSQKDACLLGVYLHGMAGDIAAEDLSQEALIAGDIINCIGKAYKKIKGLREFSGTNNNISG